MSTPLHRTIQLARLRLANAADTTAVGHQAITMLGYAEGLRDFGLVTRAEYDELTKAIADAANLRLHQLQNRAACGRMAVLA